MPNGRCRMHGGPSPGEVTWRRHTAACRREPPRAIRMPSNLASTRQKPSRDTSEEDMRTDCITGSEAAELAIEKRARLNLLPSQSGEQGLEKPGSDNQEQQLEKPGSDKKVAKKAPPRLRQPARRGEVLVAPKAELQAHKAAFRELFGETLSDEFVDEMLTQLDSALAPGPWDVLEPGTLNAAIAIIASVKPQTELEALLAVQIVATGFAGVKFVQCGQRH